MLFVAIIASGQNSYISVTAEKGDGIYSLLRKQGVNPYEAFDDFVAVNMNNLRDSIHLYEGRNYKIPGIPIDTVPLVDSNQNPVSEIKNTEGRSFPIFGKGYETVLPKSDKLKGAVYYLVSGHGGPDPGAMAVHGDKKISEDEYA